MKKFKTNKGITLVALVITIIVLILLAGVSISLVMGDNGLATKAQAGANNYLLAANEEQSMISNLLAQAGASGSGNGGGSTTYPTYTVGETVTLGGETFYVIEASDSSTATVKLLAALNVKTTSGEGQYTQSASENTLRFDDDSNVYANSEIKPHVDAYKLAVEGRMGSGKTIEEARLMTKEEVVALGGDLSSTSTSGCTGTTAFVNATNYWLGSPNESINNYEWIVYGENGYVSNISVFLDEYYGLRPVLVVLKSNI